MWNLHPECGNSVTYFNQSLSLRFPGRILNRVPLVHTHELSLDAILTDIVCLYVFSARLVRWTVHRIMENSDDVKQIDPYCHGHTYTVTHRYTQTRTHIYRTKMCGKLPSDVSNTYLNRAQICSTYPTYNSNVCRFTKSNLRINRWIINI